MQSILGDRLILGFERILQQITHMGISITISQFQPETKRIFNTHLLHAFYYILAIQNNLYLYTSKFPM